MRSCFTDERSQQMPRGYSQPRVGIVNHRVAFAKSADRDEVDLWAASVCPRVRPLNAAPVETANYGRARFSLIVRRRRRSQAHDLQMPSSIASTTADGCTPGGPTMHVHRGVPGVGTCAVKPPNMVNREGRLADSCEYFRWWHEGSCAEVDTRRH
ncbi:hypothetical protein BD413DRAFT_219710 [Trametes elegans]|nr:hypothetical protein BD413DRAFT_219710 [Trametes elegans]